MLKLHIDCQKIYFFEMLGNPEEITMDLLTVISAIHQGLKTGDSIKGTDNADCFRRAVQGMTADNAAVWKDNIRHGTMVTM